MNFYYRQWNLELESVHNFHFCEKIYNDFEANLLYLKDTDIQRWDFYMLKYSDKLRLGNELWISTV